ncbi:MAG: hypothetical protein F6K17_02080 [Okeania sp. SIO3C4]|nr:hypothetical protein [Okeania sp. SIO3B3]NER01503.1 hypothetical protein [Okeania sp. SIO3C4]
MIFLTSDRYFRKHSAVSYQLFLGHAAQTALLPLVDNLTLLFLCFNSLFKNVVEVKQMLASFIKKLFAQHSAGRADR